MAATFCKSGPLAVAIEAGQFTEAAQFTEPPQFTGGVPFIEAEQSFDEGQL
jgi:hypothetical protein